MDAPICRLCREEHWPREGCKFKADPEVVLSDFVAVLQGVPTLESRLVELEETVTMLQLQIEEMRNNVTVTEPIVTPVTVTSRAGYMREYRKRKAV